MVCKHVDEALKKINELGKKAIETNSSLYGNLGPYVKYETANECISLMSKWANETNGKGVEILRQTVIKDQGRLSPFFEKVIDGNVLKECMLEIIGILNSCDCVAMEDAIRAMKDSFCEIEDYERLRREKDEEIRRLKEKLRLFEENQGFEAKQEFPPYNR